MSSTRQSPTSQSREFVYVWKTSLPPYILRNRRQDLKHISETKGPKNTLEFLVETQKYIAKIRKPQVNSTPSTPRGNAAESGRRRLKISIPEDHSTLRPNTVATPRALCLRARSYEKLSRNASAAECTREDTHYAITKYMLTRPMSPRFLHLPAELSQSSKLSPKKVYKNSIIDTFMNRFERK